MRHEMPETRVFFSAEASSGWLQTALEDDYIGPILGFTRLTSLGGYEILAFAGLAQRRDAFCLPRRACERHRREAAIKKQSSDALDAR